MSGHRSAGTCPFFQCEMAAFCRPNAAASFVALPAALQACSMGVSSMLALVSDNCTTQTRNPILPNGNMESFLYAFCMGFKERLKEARAAAKLTGDALGSKLGYSKQNVSHWEAGRFEPNIETIAKMCEVLDVPADWLLLGRSPENISLGALQFARYYDSLSEDAQKRLEGAKTLVGDSLQGDKRHSAVSRTIDRLGHALGDKSLTTTGAQDVRIEAGKLGKGKGA